MASELTVGSLSNVKTAGNIHMESTLPVIHLDGAGGAAKSSAIYFTEAGHDAPYETVNGYAGSIEYDGVVNQLVIGGYSGGTAKPGIKIARDTGLCSFSNGIAFSSQTDTSATGAAATSTTLDHYEEGTWTPVVRDLAGNVATCSTADGSFTRIGNRVFIGFNVQLSSIGSMTGSYVLITGLPFNHLATADNGTGTIDYFTNFDTSYSGLALDTSSTAWVLWLTGTAAGGGATQVYVPVSAISGDERIKGGAQYNT